MKNDQRHTRTKGQELLTAFSGTKEDLEAFIDSIPNDEKYQAWKAAHPERAEARKNMTREEKTEYLADLIIKLMEKEQQRAEQEQLADLRELLNKQYVPTSPEFDLIRRYIIAKKAESPVYSEALMCIDVFNYGVMCGKRAERARRKGEQV